MPCLAVISCRYHLIIRHIFPFCFQSKTCFENIPGSGGMGSFVSTSLVSDSTLSYLPNVKLLKRHKYGLSYVVRGDFSSPMLANIQRVKF